MSWRKSGGNDMHEDFYVPKSADPKLHFKICNHIQGIAKWKGGWIISRNSEEHGELLNNHCVDLVVAHRFGDPHVGGIDTCSYMLACCTYGGGHGSGHLHIGHGRMMDDACSFDLDYRPYAVGLECYPLDGGYTDKDDWILAIVSEADGTEIRWYRWREDKDGLEHLGNSAFDKDIGARNNIVLSCDNLGLVLYTLRAHLGFGVVRRFRVDVAPGGVKLRQGGKYRQRSGLCSIRFGATVIHEGGKDYLVKTARNVFRHKLRVVRNEINWWTDGHEMGYNYG